MFPHDRVSGFALMLGALLLAVAGCSDGETGSAPAAGAARVHIATTRVNAGEITRVTVTASSGATVDLDRSSEGTGFVGALTLPVGPGELVGRAFIEEALVAESQPTPVVIEEGAVTSVMLRLFDLTGGDGPDYGPLIVSLFHPETAVASQPAQLSVMAVDPDGDAVTILWSSDCADASFSDPGASETQWVKSAEGACNITVTASAGGLSASESFRIVVSSPPPPSQYLRASLRPLVRLTPQSEFARFQILGQSMQASDFQSGATVVSMAERLDALGAQIGAERGTDPLDLFVDPENRARAALIPFRGKPSDVAVLELDGVRKAYVPLGGTFGSPGNEVAAVHLGNGAVARVPVGVRPQRVAVHQRSGLVFVCNQLSNYISIIDGRSDARLEQGGAPVEIATDFYCADLALVERSPSGDLDQLYLYVANGRRRSVLKYSIDIVRDGDGDPVDVRINPAAGKPAHEPLAEIVGVGASPGRLRVGESRTTLYVAGRRGGDLAVIEIAGDSIQRRIALGAPAADVLQIADQVYVPTTTPFRGLLENIDGSVPAEVNAAPALVTGLDGQTHEAHPGALFDATASYGFEDVRSGIFQISADLVGAPSYVTDDNEVDDSFGDQQKVLAGAVPQAITRTAAGDRVYVALSGSDLIQELRVASGSTFRLQATGRVLQTSEVPVALALDENAGVLLSVSRGSDMLEIFSLLSGLRVAQIDLGYAQPRFPATAIEAGEYLFHTARWSNDARKACTGCHFDEGITDGLSFSTGTTAPTAYHKVKPVWNLLTTDAYGWNGSSVNGSQASLAIEAQTRTSCELITYGLIDGPSSAPADRIGDVFNFTRGADDVACRPNTAVLDQDALPTSLQADVNGDGVSSFQDIRDVIAAQREIAAVMMPQTVQAQLMRAGLALERAAMVRAIDFFTVSELRLPPNPLADPDLVRALDPALESRLASGEQIFRDVAKCDGCHDPEHPRHPFADGRAHGQGADFAEEFVIRYAQDQRLIELLPGGIPDPMFDGLSYDTTPQEVDFHHNSLDFLIPFCFAQNLCLSFHNPLATVGTAEGVRLRRLIHFYLANPEGGFIPGQVVAQPRVDTPSLRGTWLEGRLLRHGHAQSVREAMLAPGHPALQPGERGLAVDRFGRFDVHGETVALSPAQVEDLVLYVNSIE